MTIPHIMELSTAPRLQPPIFVRHALDSPWVESRMDVLVAAVPVMVGYFQPVICEDSSPAAKSGLYPSRKSLGRTGEPFPKARARCVVMLRPWARRGRVPETCACSG